MYGGRESPGHSGKPGYQGKPVKGPQGSFKTQPTDLNFTSWHPNTSFF